MSWSDKPQKPRRDEGQQPLRLIYRQLSDDALSAELRPSTRVDPKDRVSVPQDPASDLKYKDLREGLARTKPRLKTDFRISPDPIRERAEHLKAMLALGEGPESFGEENDRS